MKRMLIAAIAAPLAFGLAAPPAAVADVHRDPCGGSVPVVYGTATLPDGHRYTYGVACWTGGSQAPASGVFGVYDTYADGHNVKVVASWAGGGDSAQTNNGQGYGDTTRTHGPFISGTTLTVTIEWADGSFKNTRTYHIN